MAYDAYDVSDDLNPGGEVALPARGVGSGGCKRSSTLCGRRCWLPKAIDKQCYSVKVVHQYGLACLPLQF